MSNDDKIDCPEIDTLIQGLETAKVQVQTAGKAAVAALFKQFFAEYPEATAVAWRQYTPSFNDGDPCTFRMTEANVSTATGFDFSTVSRLDEDDDIEPFFKNMYSLDEGMLEEGMRRLSRSMKRDIFEVAFGDGVMIIATPDGFHINEYDHY